MSNADERYNPLQHVEVREKVGLIGLYVETSAEGRSRMAAEVERMAIAAIHAAAVPLLADVANLRHQMTLTLAAARSERDRMRGNDDALRARLAAAEAEVERLRAEADAARATERRVIVAYLRTRLGYGPLADAIERGNHRREG
jgi:hypothetical protein